MTRSELSRLTAWHLPGGSVGPPARWAATSSVEVGKGWDGGARRERGKSHKEEREGGSGTGEGA